MTNSPNPQMKRDLIVTRLFNAPAKDVWKAWSDPQYIMRWWGPDHFTAPLCKMDFREGGRTLVCMRSPTGQDFFNTWTYQKIVPLERIEFILSHSDNDGNPVDPVKLGFPDLAQDVLTLVTLKALGEKTEMTIIEYGMPSPETQMGKFAEMGLNQSMDKMGATFK